MKIDTTGSHKESPALKAVNDEMHAGYELLHQDDEEGALAIWLKTWDKTLALFDELKVESLDQFDGHLESDYSVHQWLDDLQMVLWNLGGKEEQFLQKRLSVSEEILKRFPQTKTPDLSHENHRRYQAETLWELGEAEKADSLFKEWLAADPQWGWGWIGWSDLYHFGCGDDGDRKNPARSEEILKAGLAVDGVRDRADILERLRDVLEAQMRTAEANALEPELKELRKRAIFEGLSIPADPQSIAIVKRAQRQISGEAIQQRQAKEVARNIKVGRNDPCPCLSGKKFKKCCGRSLWAP